MRLNLHSFVSTVGNDQAFTVRAIATLAVQRIVSGNRITSDHDIMIQPKFKLLAFGHHEAQSGDSPPSSGLIDKA